MATEKVAKIIINMMKRLNKIALISCLIAIPILSLPLSPTVALAEVTLEIVSPSDGETVGGILPIEISFSTTKYRIAYIWCYPAGYYYPPLQTPPYSGSHTYYWDTTSVLDGKQYIGVQTRMEIIDPAEGAEDNITVIINNSGPAEYPVLGASHHDPNAETDDPVNFTNGNMFHTTQDLFIPGQGMPFDFSRTYNSQDSYTGPLGYGWTHSYNINLTEAPNGDIVEMDEDGTRIIFTRQPDDSYTPPKGEYSTLTKNADASFTLTRKHGTKYDFNPQGVLTGILDRNNNEISLSYNAEGLLESIADTSNRITTFTYNTQARLIQLTDPASRTITYNYDINGDLISTTDPAGNLTQYNYDADHNLTMITNPEGNHSYFLYDSNDRAIETKNDGNNYRYTISYDQENLTTYLTNANGYQSIYVYNENGLVTSITDSQSHITAHTWDEGKNRTSTTDANNNTTLFTYDQRGNLLSTTDPENNTTLFAYDSVYDFVTTVTNPLNNTTTYEYDEKGNLIRLTDAKGNVTNYTYDGQGNLISATDANNNTTLYVYDTQGNLILTTDASGNQTGFTYDILSNLIQATDARGNATQFSYDLLNKLTQVTYPDATTVNHTYDTRGNRTSITDQNGFTTNYAYDTVNRLIQVTNPLANPTSYTYDKLGNRTSIADANNQATQHIYNYLNRLIKTVTPSGEETLFSYDPVGNLLSKTDANGNATNYTYDELNRLILTTYPDDTKVEFTYDALGRRSTMTDSTGLTTYTYDELGRLIEADGPEDNDTITYTYDDLGNRIQMLDQDGGETSYEYDELNRLISLTAPEGKAATYSYDEVSNLTQMVYPNNTQGEYTFDSLNRLLGLVNKGKNNGIISSYNYHHDASGIRDKVILANGDYIIYSYDSINQLTSEERYSPNNDLIYSFFFTFDPAGNRLTQGINFSSEDLKIKGFPKKATIEHTYNLENQLIQTEIYKITKEGESKLTKTIDYIYDANGNLIEEITTGKNGQLKKSKSYTYDYENRLTQITIVRPDKEDRIIRFSYDGLGRRVSKTVNRIEGEEEEKTYHYLYDGLNVIIERNQEGQSTSTYLRGLSYGGGIGSIISRTNKNNRAFYYHYDGLGNVIQLTNPGARLKNVYTYDAHGNILDKETKRRNPYKFSTKEYNAGLYYFGARYYNPRIGRFITKDVFPGNIYTPSTLHRYAYVSNNPINLIDPWGLCEKDAKGWWNWYLYESALPGRYGQPVSEWGPQGPTGWGDPMKYTEEAGGAWMWTERITLGTSAGATLTAAGAMTAPAIKAAAVAAIQSPLGQLLVKKALPYTITATLELSSGSQIQRIDYAKIAREAAYMARPVIEKIIDKIVH